MPGCGYRSLHQAFRSQQSGDQPRQILRVRYAIEAIPEDKCNLEVASQPESRQTAYEVASKAIVLLKNEGALPVAKDVRKVAVIGLNAVALTQAGGVGAGVKSVYEITPLAALQESCRSRSL